MCCPRGMGGASVLPTGHGRASWYRGLPQPPHGVGGEQPGIRTSRHTPCHAMPYARLGMSCSRHTCAINSRPHVPRPHALRAACCGTRAQPCITSVCPPSHAMPCHAMHHSCVSPQSQAARPPAASTPLQHSAPTTSGDSSERWPHARVVHGHRGVHHQLQGLAGACMHGRLHTAPGHATGARASGHSDYFDPHCIPVPPCTQHAGSSYLQCQAHERRVRALNVCVEVGGPA